MPIYLIEVLKPIAGNTVTKCHTYSAYISITVYNVFANIVMLAFFHLYVVQMVCISYAKMM